MKKVINFFFALLFFAAMAGCKVSGNLNKAKYKQDVNSIKISFDSSLFKQNEMFLDSVHKFDFSYIKSGGLEESSFSIAEASILNILSLVPIILRPNVGSFERYLIYPGETIIVKMEKDGSLTYEVKENVNRTTELKCSKILFDYLSQLNQISINKYFIANDSLSIDKNKLITEFREQLKDLSKIRRLFVDSLSGIYSLNEKIRDYFVDFVRYDSLTNLYGFYMKYKNRLFSSNEWRSMYKHLIFFADSIFGVDKSYYYSQNVDDLFEIVNRDRKSGIVLRNRNDFIQQYVNASTFFSGSAREYLLSKLIYQALSKRIPIDEYITKSKSDVFSDRYREEISYKIEEYRRLTSSKFKKSNDVLLSYSLEKKTSLSKIISKRKGQLILIDFWASWCIPCREEMPFLRKLIQKYSDTEISFVFVSLDRKIEKWREANVTEKLNPHNSFLFVDFKNSAFLSQHEIDEIPRYILISKSGLIVEDKAPAPSELALEILVNNWLKE